MDGEQQPTPGSAYLTAMIIWGAMIAGLLMIGAVLYVMAHGGEPTLEGPVRSTMLAVSLGMLIVGSVAGLAARWWFMRQRDASGGVPIEVFGTGHIVSLAIVEGAAVASLVLMFVAGDPMLLAIPVLVGAGVMALMKPSKALLAGGPGASGEHGGWDG